MNMRSGRCSYHNPSRRDAGNVMVLTVMVMLLITVMSVGVLSVTSNTMFMTSRQRMGSEAFNVAESGAEMGALWLRQQSYAPSGVEPFDPFGGSRTLSGGTYSVIVRPDTGNPTAYLKQYTVVATGTVGSQSRKVEIVVRQATFGRFAYFTDKETSSISGGTIWWKAGEICDGPAHSNNTSGTNFSINYNGSTAPIFRDLLTASGSSITYNPSKPTTETTYKKIFLDGSKGFKLGVPRIELPPSTDAQKNASWGSETGHPTTATGVYLRSDSQGGIYIRGDAAVEMGVDGSGNQTIKVTQGSNVTNITVNLAANTTTSTGPVGTGSPTSCGNVPNGVVYCSGNITSLKGTVADNLVQGGVVTKRSAWTIATDVNANKDILITNRLVYRTRPDKTQDPDAACNLSAGTLGLVARNIRITTAAPTGMEIDAVCLAGGQNTTAGSFYADSYDTRAVGTLTLLGGIIQKNRGPVNTFNSSTGQTVSGYTKNYSYDPRLATDPPPYYPTTGTYERMSWRILP